LTVDSTQDKLKSMADTLQTKLQKVLEPTYDFFLVENATPDQDRKTLDQLRTLLLALTSDASDPSFERMMAYILGGVVSEAHYPLQCVRMAGLTALALRHLPSASVSSSDDFIAGAFFADFGFRASWLSQEGHHFDLVRKRLISMNLPWVTPLVLDIVTHHHDPAHDVSPHHIVSLIAEYLFLVYGMGSDDAPAHLNSPVKALEIMTERHGHEPDGIRLLIKCLSAFPLGSWVRLNSGQVAFVVASNRENPLRPTVGLYKSFPSAPKDASWQEWPLDKEATAHIVQELTPTTLQQAFANSPFLWIPQWKGQSFVSVEELKKAFQEVEGAPTSASTASTQAHAQLMENLWMDGGAGPRVGTLDKSRGAPAPAPRDARAQDLRRQTGEGELGKLREEWKRYSEQVEGAIHQLKDGLLESYKRENEQYKSVLGNLTEPPPIQTPKAPPTAPVVAVAAPVKTSPAAAPTPSVPASQPKPAAALDDTARWKALRKKTSIAHEQLLALRTVLEPSLQELQKTISSAHETEARLSKAPIAELPAEDHQALRPVLERLRQELQRLESETADPARKFPLSWAEWERIEKALREVETAPSGVDVFEKQMSAAFARAHEELTQRARNVQLSRQAGQRLIDLGSEMDRAIAGRLAAAYLQRALQQRPAQPPQEAIPWLEKALTSTPDLWEAHALLGACYLSQKDFRALAHLEKALTQQPTYPRLEACVVLARKVLKPEGSKEAR
jgi:tetratricopeptide (TPR) repeat protein